MKRHPNCKLSIAEEQELLAYYNSGYSLSEVGAVFGLSLTGAQKIMKHYHNPCRYITDSQTGIYYNNKESFFKSLKPNSIR